MTEGVIGIPTVGVYKSGDVDFDITKDATGTQDVTEIYWGHFGEWNPLNWEDFAGDPTTWLREEQMYVTADGAGRGEGKARFTKWTPPSDLEAEVRSMADLTVSGGTSEAQVILRWTYDDEDIHNYYFGGVGAWGYKAAIGKVVDNVSTLIAYSAEDDSVIQDRMYKTRFKAVGDKLFLYVDDKLECWTTDTDIEAGWTGLRVYNSKIQFDNYYVRDINGVIIEQDKFGDFVRDTSFYVVNREASPITFIADATDIDPPELVDKIDISWDLSSPIQPGQSQRVNITLEVLPDAPEGDFFFNVTVRGNLT